MNVIGYAGEGIGDVGPLRKAALFGLVLAAAIAIALLPLPYAGGLVAGIGALVLLLVRPELGLWLLVFAVPYGSFKEGGSGGIDLPLTEPLVVIVVALWLAKGVRERRISIGPAPLYIPLLFFLGLMAFSLTTAPSMILSAKELLKWMALLMAYAFVVSNVKGRRQVLLLLSLIMLAGVSESLLGFYQFVAKAGPKGFAIGPFLRAFGTFGQPNPYAGYLTIVATLTFGLILYSFKAPRPLPGGTRALPGWLLFASWVTFGACAAAIVMSFSRGALLGLFAGVGAVTVLSSRRAMWGALVLMAILALLLAPGTVQMLPTQMTARVSETFAYFGVFDVRKVQVTPDNWPIVERMANWQAAWYMFEDNPLLGVGVGNYPEAYRDYYLPGWKDAKGHAHNFYLNVLAEMGLFGLVAYLSLLASFFIHGFRALKRVSQAASLQLERHIVIGALGVLAALSVHNFFDNLFVHGIGVQIGLILGLISVIDRGPGSAETRPDTSRKMECIGALRRGEGRL